MIYEYSIDMTWVNNVSKETFEITSDNINHIVMENDYRNALMPTIYAKLSLDKKKLNKLIQEIKDSIIRLNIFKIQKKDDDTKPTLIATQYCGDTTYFIPKDINYNVDLDYSDDNEEREDMFQTFSIGLMFKWCIDANKQTNNTTIVNTTPFNAIMYFIKDTPILIEPFTYNEPFPQLIIPPQDSLYKTIDFFNDLNVFYDTSYRFYIEPGCVYLMSSSGKPLEKIGEKYETIMFAVRGVKEKEAANEGMEENDSLKMYFIDINVKDTEYVIDNITPKIYKDLAVIIDPSRNNDITLLKDVNDVMVRINAITDDMNAYIREAANSIQNIPNQLALSIGYLTDQSDTIFGCSKEAQEDIEAILKETNALPASSPTGPFLDLATKALVSKAVSALNPLVNSAATALKNLVPNFKIGNSYLANASYKFTSTALWLNGITPINYSDNADMLNKQIKSTDSDLSKSKLKLNTDIIPGVMDINGLTKGYSNAFDAIITASNKIDSTLPSGATNPIKEKTQKLPEYDKTLKTASSNISKTTDDYKKSQDKIDNSNAIAKQHAHRFSAINKDIKKNIVGVGNDLNNIGPDAHQSLDNIITNAKNILSNAGDVDLSINSLEDFQKDINIVRDISKIGRLGLSNIVADLALGTTNADGSRIIRVANDNVNMIKNVKSDIENSMNNLTLNKNGLDTSIFTPNKRYIVYNYNAHSKKNGLFILHRKVDMFIRHGDTYTCNTRLELSKITNMGSKLAKDAGLDTKVYDNSLKSALNIIKASKKGITLDNLSDVIANAQNIHDIYISSRHNKKTK